MDFRRFKTPDWLMIGGAVGFLVFGFLDWVTIKRGGNHCREYRSILRLLLDRAWSRGFSSSVQR